MTGVKISLIQYDWRSPAETKLRYVSHPQLNDDTFEDHFNHDFMP